MECCMRFRMLPNCSTPTGATATIPHPDHMTPQAKSLQGSKTCGLYIEHGYQQEMPTALSCLYAVSPPLRVMFSEYSKIGDNERLKVKPPRRTYSQNALSSEPKKYQDFYFGVETESRFQCKRNHLDRNTPMKSCLKPKSSANKTKSVTFADAQGFALTGVKYITESTEDPPQWEGLNEICKSFKNGLMSLNPDPTRPAKDLLVADFDQPSADYLKFKKMLEQNGVCLENVMFNTQGLISGTVKVKNIGYGKIVFIRMTLDEWNTSRDYNASFVRSFSDYEEYDTFQFSIPLPDSFDCTKQRAVFCICYKANCCEFWDNNSGRNYSAKADAYAGLSSSRCCTVQRRRFSLPSTYDELPTPEFNTWVDWEKIGPFY